MGRKFSIGDRVICIDDFMKRTNGKSGVVVDVDCFGVGVCFDEFIGGHDLGGKKGHGWYLPEKYVEHLECGVPSIDDLF